MGKWETAKAFLKTCSPKRKLPYKKGENKNKVIFAGSLQLPEESKTLTPLPLPTQPPIHPPLNPFFLAITTASNVLLLKLSPVDPDYPLLWLHG